MAAALLGDVPAARHLATSAEAVDRGTVMRSSDVYCITAPGEQILSLKRITVPQSTALGGARRAKGATQAGTLHRNIGHRREAPRPLTAYH